MKCESLQFNLPLYHDDVLSDDERTEIDRHLPSCPLCRLKLEEYRTIKGDFRMAEKINIPGNLLESVRKSVKSQLEAPTIKIGPEPGLTFWEKINHWMMPYSVGTAAALLIAFVLLTNLVSTKNAADELVQNERSKDDTAILLAKSDNPTIQEDLGIPGKYTSLALGGNTPRVNPAGALFAVTKSVVRGEMEDDEVVLVADVFGNGLAKINQFIKPPYNRGAKREIEKAFQTDPEKAPFLPPKLEKNSKAIRVVLKIQRVDVN